MATPLERTSQSDAVAQAGRIECSQRAQHLDLGARRRAVLVNRAHDLDCDRHVVCAARQHHLAKRALALPACVRAGASAMRPLTSSRSARSASAPSIIAKPGTTRTCRCASSSAPLSGIGSLGALSAAGRARRSASRRARDALRSRAAAAADADADADAAVAAVAAAVGTASARSCACRDASVSAAQRASTTRHKTKCESHAPATRVPPRSPPPARSGAPRSP